VHETPFPVYPALQLQIEVTVAAPKHGDETVADILQTGHALHATFPGVALNVPTAHA
jgi:hypothetical protein